MTKIIRPKQTNNSAFDNVIALLESYNFRGFKIIITLCCLSIIYFWYQPMVYQGNCSKFGLLFMHTMKGSLDYASSYISTQSGSQGMDDFTIAWFVMCGVIIFTTWARWRKFNILPSVLLVLSASVMVLSGLIGTQFCLTWFNLALFGASVLCLYCNRHLDKAYKIIDTQGAKKQSSQESEDS